MKLQHAGRGDRACRPPQPGYGPAGRHGRPASGAWGVAQLRHARTEGIRGRHQRRAASSRSSSSSSSSWPVTCATRARSTATSCSCSRRVVALFAIQIATRLSGPTCRGGSASFRAVILLLQPFLTLRLAGHFVPVPRAGRRSRPWRGSRRRVVAVEHRDAREPGADRLRGRLFRGRREGSPRPSSLRSSGQRVGYARTRLRIAVRGDVRCSRPASSSPAPARPQRAAAQRRIRAYLSWPGC